MLSSSRSPIMKSYLLSHLEDHVLLRDLATLVSQDRATTAALLAHLAEVEERKLYARAAYSSMHLYCVRELRMSEGAAFKRIRVARTARQFPSIFAALADGRLNMTGVVLLRSHLTQETADELLAAAAHKTNAEIELLLAQRFPRPDAPTLVQAIGAPVASDELSVRTVESTGGQLALEPAESAVPQLSPGTVALPAESMPPARARLTPLSPGRFA